MDKDDRQQDLVGLLNGPMNDLKAFFKPEFAKGLTVGGEKLVIDSFSHGAIGKFIALYGLDDLIGSLPESLKEFQIQNRGNDNKNVTITIPEEIGRFKDLNMILLDNCITSIPESICTLPKLRFLALINNKELKTIPECVSNLPSLLFLNLKGSPNVEVPNAIKEKGTDMGGGMWDLQD
jgi:Leucine-rich repeat (LRR) protein